MIDLNKPIRRKVGGSLVAVWDAPYRVYNGDTFVQYTKEELERDYENVPEPRKPREWGIVIRNDHTLGAFNGKVTQLGLRDIEAIRVIEWPEGYPLPDWPEDGG